MVAGKPGGEKLPPFSGQARDMKNMRHSLTMGGWTAIGQTLDRKSSLCPRSVHTLSRVCPMAKKVQGLSSRCLTDVEILSKFMVFRQRLDKKIQHLSTDCPIEQP